MENPLCQIYNQFLKRKDEETIRTIYTFIARMVPTFELKI